MRMSSIALVARPGCAGAAAAPGPPGSSPAVAPPAVRGGRGGGGGPPPPQRVAERVAEAAVERLDDERAAVLLHVLGGYPGDLEIEHRDLLSGSCAACGPAAFRGAYFEYSSTMSCSCTGAAISRRSGLRSTFAVSESWSAWSQAGTCPVSSVASRMTCDALD